MIYLDDSSTTPIDPKILEYMLPYYNINYGNPSSTHSFGQKSRFGVDEARYTIAHYLGCTPQEIVFTATGSESISLAIKGTAEYLATQGEKFEPQNVYLVTSPLEHSAVHKTITHLAFWGYQNKVVDVDTEGRILLTAQDSAVVNQDTTQKSKLSLEEILQDIKKQNTQAKVLISVQYVNSEIGTIQDIPMITEIARKYGALVHTDAMQAAKLLNLNVTELGVDLLTMAAHKIYGPLGAALLYIKSGSRISRQIDGGEQEYKIRAGTQNTPAVVGFGKAVEQLDYELTHAVYTTADSHQYTRREYIEHLSHLFVTKLKELIPGIRVLAENTKMSSINGILFPDINATEFLVRLDMAGIMASAGSACNSGSIQPTANLAALGLSADEINRVIRFSIGKNNTEHEILDAVGTIFTQYQAYTGRSS